MNEIKILETYEYRDGLLVRKKGGGGEPAGAVVGYSHISNGREYKRCCFERKHYYVHQIVFLMHHGYIPNRIDHIDGDSLNNKIENLRAATQSENIANSKLSKSNTSGYKGVVRAFSKKSGEKWAAQICVNGKCVRLGRFESKNDAAKAYAEAAVKYFGEYARPESTESANNRNQDKVMR